ncbi:hypothetical protein [Nocardia nova]|uniref:hypothetical protein n=1 Tax=Nocardia nova TaxID=37330 RepID=UPI0012E8969C|nr:hypothetical protein [Nocardia nova]
MAPTNGSGEQAEVVPGQEWPPPVTEWLTAGTDEPGALELTDRLLALAAAFTQLRPT